MPPVTNAEAIALVAALLLGPILVYAAPRLVAYRLESPSPSPGPAVLVPLVGGPLSGWQPRRSLAFEVVMAGLFVAFAYRIGWQLRLIAVLPEIALLLLISLIDIEHRLVLNRLSLPGVVLAVGLALFTPSGPLSSLEGLAAGFAIFFALDLIGRGKLGFGDTKLAALIGAMRGFPGVLNALYFGVLLGGLGAAFYLFVLRRSRKESIAYAPYLAAGAILSLWLAG